MVNRKAVYNVNLTSVMRASVGAVTLSCPLSEGAGASRKSKIWGRKNQATTATAKNATPTLMILERSSPRCSIRVIRASSRGREGRRRRPAIYFLRGSSGALAALLLGPVGLRPVGLDRGVLGAGSGLVLAGGELFVLLFLVLDLILAARAPSELAHTGPEPFGEFRDALRAEEQKDYDEGND